MTSSKETVFLCGLGHSIPTLYHMLALKKIGTSSTEGSLGLTSYAQGYRAIVQTHIQWWWWWWGVSLLWSGHPGKQTAVQEALRDSNPPASPLCPPSVGCLLHFLAIPLWWAVFSPPLLKWFDTFTCELFHNSKPLWGVSPVSALTRLMGRGLGEEVVLPGCLMTHSCPSPARQPQPCE